MVLLTRGHYAKSLVVETQFRCSLLSSESCPNFVPLGYIERIGLRLHFSAECSIW